jgi:hypothetical protein
VEPTVVAAKEHCDKYEMKDMDMNRVINCRLRSSRGETCPARPS